MKILLIFLLNISLSAFGAVEDIQSMVNNAGEFNVICLDGSVDFVQASLIKSDQVCSNGSSQIDAFNTCDSVFGTNSLEERCITTVREFRMNSAQITACADGFPNDSTEITCVESAGRNRLSSSGIRACLEFFPNDSTELTCIDHAKNLTAGAITACADGFPNDSTELSCIEGAGLTGLDESGIRFCLDRHPNDSSELRCIRGE